MVRDFKKYSTDKLVRSYDEVTSLLRDTSFKARYPITAKQIHRLRLAIKNEIRSRHEFWT